MTRRPCRFPSLSPLLAAVRLSVVNQTSPRPRIPRLPPPRPPPPSVSPRVPLLPTHLASSALPCTPEPAALSAGPIKVARRPGQEPALAHRNRPRAWSPLVCSETSPAPGAQARLAFDQPRPRPSTVPGPALPLGAAHRAGAARRRRRRSSPRPAGPRPSACCRACPAGVHRRTVIRGQPIAVARQSLLFAVAATRSRHAAGPAPPPALTYPRPAHTHAHTRLAPRGYSGTKISCELQSLLVSASFHGPAPRVYSGDTCLAEA